MCPGPGHQGLVMVERWSSRLGAQAFARSETVSRPAGKKPVRHRFSTPLNLESYELLPF